MDIQIVPAPLRQFKTYSMWIGLAIGTANAAIVLFLVFGSIGWLTMPMVLGINGVLGFLIVPAKLILQYVPVTNAEKVELVAAVVVQPMAPDEHDVSVHVDGVPIVELPKVPPT